MRFHATVFLLAGLLLIVAGCAEGPDEPVADAVELTPAPEFDPVTPGGDPDSPSVPVPKVDKKTSAKKVAKKVAKKGDDEGFDEDLPMVPVEQAGAMVALEAIGGEMKLDFRDRIVEIDLKGTEMDDKSAVHLAALKDVRSINLSDTKVTDAAMAHLAKLSRLNRLFLYGTEVTDKGLVHLGKLSSLETLYLDETRISDEGMSNLKGLVQLEVLHLRSRLPVSDTSIPVIIRFEKLRELKVEGTKITPEGLERLKRKLPDCRIE